MQQILIKVAQVVGREVLKVAIAETAKAIVKLLYDDNNNNGSGVA